MARAYQTPVFYVGDDNRRYLGFKNPDGTDSAFPNIPPAPLVAALGDSLTEFNTTNTASEQSFSAFGFLSWAQVLSRGQIVFPLSNNMGVTGNRIDEMLPRVPAVLNSGASYCTVLAGTNDLAQNVSARTMRQNMAALVGRIADGNVTPIVFTVTPRTGLTTAQRLRHMDFNAWLKDRFGNVPGVLLCDPFRLLADPASSTSDPLSGYLQDGVHPAQTAAYFMGSHLLETMAPLLPRRPLFWAGNADTFDATDNPRGNLLLNAGFTATTTPGAGLTGTSPTNFTASRTAGTGSATIAVQPRTDGVPGNEILLTINVSGQSATEEWKIRQSVSAGATTYTAGEAVLGACEIDVSSSTNLRWLFLYLDDNNGVSIVNTARALSSASFAMPTQAWSGLMRTSPIVVRPYGGSGTQALTLGVTVAVNGTSSGVVTVKIRAPQMRKLLDSAP